jgi:hypothetical protein
MHAVQSRVRRASSLLSSLLINPTFTASNSSSSPSSQLKKSTSALERLFI